jgi:hypothetical protein
MESNVKDGKVWMSVEDFLTEHERLLKVLKKGSEYEDQKKELEEVKAEIARQEQGKKSPKNASTISMDALKEKLPEAPKPTFQGNLNAY